MLQFCNSARHCMPTCHSLQLHQLTKSFIHKNSTLPCALTKSRPCFTSQQRCRSSTSLAMTDSHLWSAITERYDHAQAAAAATMTDTSTQVLKDGGVGFVLRVAAKLRDKPKGPSPSGGKKEWKNPFLPPEPDLFVLHLSHTHSLLLNKFNIVPHHVLIVTRDFQRQEDPISLADFAATLEVLKAMPSGALAYYNSGPVSGASQPHKHIQAVPLPLSPSESAPKTDPPFWPTIRAATAEGVPQLTVQKITQLPFVNFTAILPPNVAAESLTEAYNCLLIELEQFVEEQGQVQGQKEQERALSYNMVMTEHYIMLIPRREERQGPVSCNAMAFAGSFFVRSTEELEYIRSAGPMHALQQVGYSWS